MGLRENLRGKRAYFDSNVFIYLIEGFSSKDEVLQEIRQSIYNREVQIFTSELTFGEVLVLPFRNRDMELYLSYCGFLEDDGVCTLVPASREMFALASVVSANTKMKLPDSVHVATAINTGCSIFVSNDLGIKLPKSTVRQTI